MHRRIAVLFALLVTVTLRAQQPEFKAGVELVTVPVTVTSLDHNTYIDGLTAADFRVSENGDRQTVTTVTRERRPLSICFIVDSSGSIAIGTRKVLATLVVDRIVGQLQPDDEITIVGIGVGSANIQDLRSDIQGVRRLPSASGQSLGKIDAAMPGAGEDVRRPNALPNFDYLETVVGDSGGSISRVLSQPEVAMAAKNIVDELQYEYVIGYTPLKPLDGKYRKLKVEVSRRGLFIRHRGGYLALPQAP